MKWIYVIILMPLLYSCWIPVMKYNRKLEVRGYNPRLDTTIIRPYEFYIKHKGFTPVFRECPHANELNLTMSIRGYEEAEYIPLSRLQDTLEIVISDPSIKQIESGTLFFQLRSGGMWLSLKTDNDGYCKILFPPKPVSKIKKVYPEFRLFFFCVNVVKDGTVYTLPSRTYLLQ